MKKELTVLAECVDERSGTRFQPGDQFEPAPGIAQAIRLIKAGCLPEGALDVARKADDDREKAEAAARKKQDEAAAIAAAEAAHTAAETVLSDAQSKLATAPEADRAEAQKLVDAAKADLEAAAKSLAKAKR